MARRPPETVANPARGIALVVVAVLVGLFLLRGGLDDSSSSIDTGTDAGSETDGSDSSDDGSTTTTEAAAAARPPAQVKAIVLNGSGVTGAAKRFSDVLANVQYDLTDADGDNSTLKPATTQVLYTEGYEAEAQAVAALISAPASGVQPLGTQTPGNTAGADVIVILAADRASDQTPETPG